MLTNKSDGIQLPFTLRNQNASDKEKLSCTAKRCIPKDCDGIFKQQERNSDDGSFRALKK